MRRTSRIGAAGVILLLIVDASAGAETQRSFADTRPRIVNGVLTSEYPTTAALLFPGDASVGELVCSGTLIGCATILTAAHCVCDLDGTACLGINAPKPSDYVVFLAHAGFFHVTSIALRSDYEFPVADVAVLKLGTRVTGISPTPIDTIGASPGTTGTIVGFGRSGGSNNDVGIKRAGAVTVASCTGNLSNATSVCWNFSNPLGSPGSNSNTCNGDSGGPLFVDHGFGPTVAGVTSGGDSFNCLPEDMSYDARVSFYSSWIESMGGADLGDTACGSIPPVGSAGARIVSSSRQLSGANSEATDSFQVPPGTILLRVAMNATEAGLADFDLYVKAGAPPTTSDFDCVATGSGQYGFCEFAAPAPGTWHTLARRASGSGTYQITATLFGTDCSLPANDGQSCDDSNLCTEDDACQSGTCAGVSVLNGTPCDDGNACTDPDFCQSGICTPTSAADGTPCDDGSLCTQDDFCQAGSCNGTTPALACKQPLAIGKASLLLKGISSGAKDKLIWKWVKGEATEMTEFGDPTDGSTFGLCVYDDSGSAPQLLMEKVIPAGGQWTRLGNGFKYKDKDAGNDGLRNVLLKAGRDNRAKIIMRGKGSALGLSSLAVDHLSALTVQLLNDSTCWEAHYTSTSNKVGEFKAKSD